MRRPRLRGGLRKVRQVFDPIFAPIVADAAASAEGAALRVTVAGPGRWVLAAQLPAAGAMVLAAGPIMAIYGAGSEAAHCGWRSWRSRTAPMPLPASWRRCS